MPLDGVYRGREIQWMLELPFGTRVARESRLSSADDRGGMIPEGNPATHGTIEELFRVFRLRRGRDMGNSERCQSQEYPGSHAEIEYRKRELFRGRYARSYGKPHKTSRILRDELGGFRFGRPQTPGYFVHHGPEAVTVVYGILRCHVRTMWVCLHYKNKFL